MELLLSLLRNALWGAEKKIQIELSEEMTALLFSLAEEQTVSGLVIDALICNNVRMPQQWVFEAVGLDAQIKQANKELNDGLTQLVNLPIKDYVVIKGQTLAAIYPNPSLRMPGDIDFLVRHYDDAKDVLKREWNVELPAKLVDREYAFEYDGVTYEIHDQLIIFGRKKHQNYWNELMKRPYGYVSIDNVKVPTLEPTVNAIYVFLHMFSHFLRDGVSLRQLCDWAMVLHHYRDEIDREQLNELINKLDLYKAYCAFGTILVEELGLPVGDFPYSLSVEERKWKDKILRDIFKGGSFGKLYHHTDNSWKYKIETMRIVMRNSSKYYRLCPSEVGTMIPRLVKQNLKIWAYRLTSHTHKILELCL